VNVYSYHKLGFYVRNQERRLLICVFLYELGYRLLTTGSDVSYWIARVMAIAHKLIYWYSLSLSN
jgi:hypothetical protein